jgi:hypothetical protein
VGIAALGAGAGKVLLTPSLGDRGLATPDGVFGAASIAFGDALYIEEFPTSPLILHPFTDPLPIPRALTPLTPAQVAALNPPPGPGLGQQNSFRNETHQIWVDALGLPDPIVYKIDLLVRQHSFTSSQVRPIDDNGDDVESFDANGNTFPPGTIRTLPPSTIYSFNGIFPGPMINAEYGKPVLVRFTNRLDENPLNLDGRTSARRTSNSSPTCTTVTPHRRATETPTTRPSSARGPRDSRCGVSWTTST